MVSSVKNGNHLPPADNGPLDPDGAYQLYRQFLSDEQNWLLARPEVVGSAELQDHYRRVCTPEPRDEFVRRLEGMSVDDRRRYETRLIAGHRATLKGVGQAPDAAAVSDDLDARQARAAIDTLFGPVSLPPPD